MKLSGGASGLSNKESEAEVVRHRFIDRALHWFMAVCIFVLLGTSLLPVYGIKFSWVQIHWMTGLLLAGAVLTHAFRSVISKTPRHMWFGIGDIVEIFTNFKKDLTGRGTRIRPGKYSPPQKLLHHAITILVLTAVITGFMMMSKVDTFLWKRNPYWLSEDKWGIVYILHDCAALLLISVIIIHIYFGLRPEKRIYTRSMLFGIFPKDAYINRHDPDRWQPDDPSIK